MVPRIPSLALALFCALPAPAGAQGIIDDYAKRFERFKKVQTAANKAIAELGVEGLPGHVALARLIQQEFYCSIRAIQLSVKESSDPMFLCSRYPSRVDKDCVSLEISVTVYWQDPKQPLSELLLQLPKSTVGPAVGTCKIDF